MSLGEFSNKLQQEFLAVIRHRLNGKMTQKFCYASIAYRVLLCRKVEHPDYNKADITQGNDFSLLLMDEGAGGGFNLPNLANIEPACLPTQSPPVGSKVSLKDKKDSWDG